MQEATISSSDQPGVFGQSGYHSDLAYDFHAGIQLVESQLNQLIAEQDQLKLIITRGMSLLEELKSALTVAVKFSSKSCNLLFGDIRHRLDGCSLVEINAQPAIGNKKLTRAGRKISKKYKDATGSRGNLIQKRMNKVI